MVTHEMKLLYFVLTVYSKSFSLANTQKTTTKISRMRTVSMYCAARWQWQEMKNAWVLNGKSDVEFDSRMLIHAIHVCLLFWYSNALRLWTLIVVPIRLRVHNTRTHIVTSVQSRLVVLTSYVGSFFLTSLCNYLSEWNYTPQSGHSASTACLRRRSYELKT